MLGLRDVGLLAVCCCLVGAEGLDPDGDGGGQACGEGVCEEVAPGPMPVLHARLGETVTFHCYAYNPCAHVVLDLEQPLDGIRVTLTAELWGSYGASMLPPDDWPNPDGMQYGMGYGFGEGGPQAFDNPSPFHTLDWVLDFGPMSGQEGGDITFVVEELPADAPSRGT